MQLLHAPLGGLMIGKELTVLRQKSLTLLQVHRYMLASLEQGIDVAGNGGHAPGEGSVYNKEVARWCLVPQLVVHRTCDLRIVPAPGSIKHAAFDSP